MNLSTILAFFTTLLLVTGQIFWKKGLANKEILLSKPATFLIVLKSPYVILGVLLYILSTLLWFKVLNIAPFSKVYPIMALAYVLGILAGAVIFKENVSLTNWVGAVLIFIGVILATK